MDKSKTLSVHVLLCLIKVIIDKSHGEVSVLEQDRIENVSLPIKNLKNNIFKISLSKKNNFILCNVLVRMLKVN